MLARGLPGELLYVPIVVSLDPPDCAWPFDICQRLALQHDNRVRAHAILGFGHLSHTCGALAPGIRPLIEAALDDPDQTVRFHANDATHDINHFLGWGLRTLDD